MIRRLAALTLLAVLALGAAVAGWRASHAPARDPGADLAAQLTCPACQGQSVAQSDTPMAAAMRATIEQQLAAGLSPAAIRAWFVQRYGRDVLSDPPVDGAGVLLWGIPVAALAAAALLAFRRRRARVMPRPPPGAARRLPGSARHLSGSDRPLSGSARHLSGSDRPLSGSARHLSGSDRPLSRAGRPLPGTAAAPGPRVWNLVALALIGMVAAVAVMSHASGGAVQAPPTPVATTDAASEVALAQALEGQGQYAAAADIYRELVAAHPDDQLRLRLAFALLRSGQPRDAADNARRILATHPDDPDALLMLGLAQRALKSPDAKATLTRFLQVAPQNPASAQVRRLLSGL